MSERASTKGREHTPGPWTYRVDTNGDNLSVQSQTGLSVVGGCGCCGSPWTAKASADANARLIAAAPCLFEALLTALPYIECAEEDDAYKPGVVAKVTVQIRAALAKASPSGDPSHG